MNADTLVLVWTSLLAGIVAWKGALIAYAGIKAREATKVVAAIKAHGEDAACRLFHVSLPCVILLILLD